MLLLLSCVLVLLASVKDVVSKPPRGFSSFPYHVKLDPNYDLYWIFNKTHIEFEVVVKTTGYVALGISNNGKMYPADVAVGWVEDNGKAVLLDGYTTAHSQPTQDTHNDWHLVSGNEQNGQTTLTFWRLLQTCDDQDTPIEEGTTRVIFAYHDADISQESGMPYHGPTQRGAKSLLLLDPPAAESPNKPLPTSIQTFEFRNRNFHVPGQNTYYHCTTWKLPDLGGKRHMIRYEPIIQAGHERLVHHILIYFCKDKIADSLANKDWECYLERPPQLQRGCASVMTSWAIGGQAFDFPDHVGYPLGTDQDPGFFIMETHYDNPTMRSDFVDDSGIRIIMTSELRQHDAGLLEVGSAVNSHQAIPPNSPEFLSTAYCHPNCLADALGDQEIHIFANLLHSHLIGYKLRTRVVRNGIELPPLAQDNHYDFDYQEMRKLPDEYTIKKGDHLIVECVYKSENRNQVTYGGLKSTDEMCLSFPLYYPRIPLTNCLSVVNYHTGPNGMHAFMNSFDWTKQSSHDSFQNLTNTTPVRTKCIGTTNNVQGNHQTYSQSSLQPKVRYQPPKVCP